MEPRGDEPKTWLKDPSTGVRWLFKPVTHASWGRQGEDWAEKITTEVAGLLGIPCAAVQLAERGEQSGTVSQDLAPDPYEMFPGSALLSGIVPGYRPGGSKVKGRPGHSLANIRTALDQCGVPPGSALPEEFGAFGAFAGYLMLDGLVANRDRHDENWAVLRPPPPETHDLLCGSYDHGSALGFGETEQKRALLVKDDRVDRWAARGTAHRFEHTGTAPTLVSHARAGFVIAGDTVRDYWLDRLQSVSDDELVSIVNRVPKLSDPTRTFIVELLRVNRRRLLDEC